eukprot:SAG11_NODE_8302_length_1032_cov_1.203644_1_plen_44_part_00
MPLPINAMLSPVMEVQQRNLQATVTHSVTTMHSHVLPMMRHGA